MRKLFWWGVALLTIGLFAVTSCEKPMSTATQEVQFKFNNPLLNGKKDLSPKDSLTPECVDATADYVRVFITDAGGVSTWYTLDLLSLGMGTTTEVLQLPAGDYVVEEFLVYSDEDGDMDGNYPAGPSVEDADDILLYASPHEGSYYDNLFNFANNVEQKFNLKPFEKEENIIDVLCYTPADYQGFGFKHFKYHPYEVHSVCFFGDICTKFWDDWGNYTNENPLNPYFGWPEHYDLYGFMQVTASGYDAQGNPIQINSTNLGADPTSDNFMPEDMVVCVEFLDDLWVDGEIWTFEVKAILPDGSTTVVGTVTVSDDPTADNYWENFGGEDGIWTWVLGDCNWPGNEIEAYGPAVLFYPDAGRIEILSAGNDNTASHDYFDVKLLGSTWNNPLYPAELFEGNVIAGWCGDLFTPILIGGVYDAEVYSSLYPWLMPDEEPGNVGPFNKSMQDYPWDILNWLANSEPLITANVADGKELQSIVWTIIHGTDPAVVTAIENQNGYGAGYVAANNVHAKAAAAIAAGTGFSPRVGDWSVLAIRPYLPDLAKTNVSDREYVQLVLVRVDP